MPPKAGKDTKKKPKDGADEAENFTRVSLPLPVVAPVSPVAGGASQARLVASLELGCVTEFQESLMKIEEWGYSGVEEFQDSSFQLPEGFTAQDVRWVRPKSLLPSTRLTDDPVKDVKKAAAPAGKGKSAKQLEVVIEDKAADADGTPLPRVVVIEDKDVNGSFGTRRRPQPLVATSSICADTLACIFNSLVELSATVDASTNTPFLWDAIYPQNAAGRPCYNPGGKYIVKLWAAGRWRSVTVDDRVPVDSNSVPVLPMSSDNRELWPLLLSKALIKLRMISGSPPLETSDDASCAAFWLYSLTGWPACIETAATTELVSGTGSLRLPAASFILKEVPREDEEAERERIRTEARLRREAQFLHTNRPPRKVQRHMATPEEVAAVAADRKSCIDHVADLVGTNVREEVFLVCMGDGKILPVLAASINDDGAVQSLLLLWRAQRQRETNDAEPPVSAEDSLPKPEEMWLSAEALETVVVVRAPTLLAQRHQSHLHFHWDAASVSARGASSATGFGVVGVTEPAPVPPILVAIHSKEVLTLEGESKEKDSQELAGIPADEWAELIIVLTADKAVENIASSGERVDSSNGDGDTAAAEISVLDGDRASILLSDLSCTSKDVGRGKGVYERVQQGTSNLPWNIIRRKVLLPAPGEPARVFRLSLTRGIGCTVSMYCTAKVDAGDAATVWAASAPASVRKAIVESGSYAAMAARDWKILRRRLLSLPHGAPDMKVRIILTVSNAEARGRVRLSLTDGSGCDGKPIIPGPITRMEETPLSGYWPAPVQLKSDECRCLVLHAAAGDGILPAGDWRLIVLTEDGALVEGPESGLPQINCDWRELHGGPVIPNHNLHIFRDVLAPTTLGQLAFRLRLSDPTVHIRMVIIEESTGRVLCDARGRGEVILLTVIPPSHLITAAGGVGSAAAGKAGAPPKAAAGGKSKRASTDAGHAAQPAYAPGNIIIDVKLDRERMEVPSCWDTAPPYRFIPSALDVPAIASDEDQSNNKDMSVVTQSAVGQPMTWRLDISAAGQATLSHDCTQLSAFASLASEWETAEPGRSARALALWGLAQKPPPAKEGEGGVSQEWITARAAALNIPIDVETRRVAAREAQPKVTFQVPALSPTATVLTEDEMIKASEERAALVSKYQEEINIAAGERSATALAAKTELQQQVAWVGAWRESVVASRTVHIKERDEVVRAMMQALANRKQIIAARADAKVAAAKKGKK